MIYCILSDSDNVEPFIEPRQLAKINGEILIKRTIRLLKENGVKDIIVTSHDPRFDNLGATRYEPLYNDYKPKECKGYWLSAFPRELLTQPITFLLGDVYYSENAIKTIVESKTASVLFFCTDKRLGYDERYIKHHDEPLAFKVENYELFKEYIYVVKKMKDKGITRREPIMWELYRVINEIDINTHKLKGNYIAINDETCDIDRVEDIMLLELKIGGSKMVRVKAKEQFDLSMGRFEKLQEIVRVNPQNAKVGHIDKGDIFLCDKDLALYFMNQKNTIYPTDREGKNNPGGRSFLEDEILEVIPEESKEAIKPIKKNTKRKTKKKEE